jgi:TonB family protein
VPRAQSNLFRAAALSVLAHGAMVLLIARAATRQAPEALKALTIETAAASSAGAEPQGELAWVDLAPPAEPAPAPDPQPVPATVDGDHARVVETPTAPRRGTDIPAATPAPDSGDGPGRPAIEAARRDSSTLRTRLSDGAHAYHVEHERTGAQAASPQPIRQEAVVGIGDSSRTRHPQSSEEVAPTMPVGAEGPTEAEVRLEPAALATAEAEARLHDEARGDGPLAAEQGRRRFEVETQGVARDNRWQRALSGESHPGQLELSSPSVGGPDPGATGRGPSDLPGAVSGPTTGTAPAVSGAEQDLARGPLALSTSEREYDRTRAEIGRRVNAALRFPKKLALMLEQGDTVVSFVVRSDGRLAGAVQVVKSAGFVEFDAAAVSAVNHAAPFPASGRTLSYSIVIAFSNPLVR